MPVASSSNTLSFNKPASLSDWLETHHSIEQELWIKIFKKGSGIESVTWNEVVIEVLCWGWIDGIKKSIDEQAYLQRITPRTSRSNWSKRNTEHAERLISEGRMKEFGLAHVLAAKADGRWQNAYVVSEMEVPVDFLAVLETKPIAKQFFETLNKSNRYVIAHGLSSAKKTETREKRFSKYMAMLESSQKPK